MLPLTDEQFKQIVNFSFEFGWPNNWHKGRINVVLSTGENVYGELPDHDILEVVREVFKKTLDKEPHGTGD